MGARWAEYGRPGDAARAPPGRRREPGAYFRVMFQKVVYGVAPPYSSRSLRQAAFE